jgi:hypothetical protein
LWATLLGYVATKKPLAAKHTHGVKKDSRPDQALLIQTKRKDKARGKILLQLISSSQVEGRKNLMRAT